MDDADRADQRIADALNDAVDKARRLAQEVPPYCYECNWCGDPTIDGARYCCKDCASDAFKYEVTLKRNGIQR
jgi:hypothetical protein